MTTTPIPDDIAKTVEAIWDEFWQYDDYPETQKKILARAIMAERERAELRSWELDKAWNEAFPARVED